MQFKVPQNIEIEDKIIAFISFRQLFILMGGGALAYIVYILSVEHFPITAYAVPVVVIILLTVLIAFMKVDNITFIKATFLFLEQLLNPSVRLWRPYTALPNELDLLGTEPVEVEKAPEKTTTSILDLDVIADSLDKNG